VKHDNRSVVLVRGFHTNVFEAARAPKQAKVLLDDTGVVWLAHLCRQFDGQSGPLNGDGPNYGSRRNRRFKKAFRAKLRRAEENKHDKGEHVP
jgi:hypothetical protein